MLVCYPSAEKFLKLLANSSLLRGYMKSNARLHFLLKEEKNALWFSKLKLFL